MLLVDQEIQKANKEKITVSEFIKNGGSLEELFDIMESYEIKDFNMDTKIPVSDMKTMKQEKYQVSISQIGYLVANMPSLNIGKKVGTELLEVYYEELVKKKQNILKTDILIIENKPNLYGYLKRNGLIVNILDIEKDNKNIKKLKKTNHEIQK